MDASFGPALRSERMRRGQSLREFADFLGTSVSTLKRWEASKAAPPEAQRERLFDLIQGNQRSEPEADSIHYGWILKIERLAALTSIRQAAERSLIPPSAWHRYETGQSPLGRNQAKRLIEQLHGAPTEPKVKFDAAELQSLVTEQPLTAARALVKQLLHGDPELPRYEAYQTLAVALMHIGDHHLCGQAYRLAAQHGALEGIDENEVTTAQISSSWRGFPEITNRTVAANRLRWMEKKLATLPPERQVDFATMRSIFIDWAGYPHLAAEVLRHANRDGLQALSLAWIEAKYGCPSLAIPLAEDFLEHENANYQFIANKVLLESHMKLENFDAAQAPLTRLLELRSTRGFWSPDLTAKKKRLKAGVV